MFVLKLDGGDKFAFDDQMFADDFDQQNVRIPCLVAKQCSRPHIDCYKIKRMYIKCSCSHSHKQSQNSEAKIA